MSLGGPAVNANCRFEVVFGFREIASELYLAVAQVKDQSNLIEGLRRLETTILKYTPQEGGFYYELAEAYRSADSIDKAISAFEAGCSRAPNDWRCFYGLGSALSAAGNADRAVKSFEHALYLFCNQGLREVGLLQTQEVEFEIGGMHDDPTRLGGEPFMGCLLPRLP